MYEPSDDLTDDGKHRTDILDSRMDGIGGGGRRTEEPVDPRATLRHYPPINLFVTPGRVCDTFSEEARLSLPSRPKCSPAEASAEVDTAGYKCGTQVVLADDRSGAQVVTAGAQRGAVPHLSTSFSEPFEQVVNHESYFRSDGVSVTSSSQVLRDSRSWDRVGLQLMSFDDVLPDDGVGSSTRRSAGVLTRDDRWSWANEGDGGTTTSARDGQVQSSSTVLEWPSRVSVRSCLPVTSLPLTTMAIRESIRSLQEEVERREIELFSGADSLCSEDQHSDVTVSNRKNKTGELTGKTTGEVGLVKCVAGNAELPAATPVGWRDVIRDVEPGDKTTVTWERADSDIEFRRGVNHGGGGERSSHSEKRLVDKFSIPLPSTSICDNNSMMMTLPMSRDVQRGVGDRGRDQLDETLPMQSSSGARRGQNVSPIQFESRRAGEQQAIEGDRPARATHYCSSPTISEEERGIGKYDVCRCHGTLEHKIFRRDTTPEYQAGDRCRPSNPLFVPVERRAADGDNLVPQSRGEGRVQRRLVESCGRDGSRASRQRTREDSAREKTSRSSRRGGQEDKEGEQPRRSAIKSERDDGRGGRGSDRNRRVGGNEKPIGRAQKSARRGQPSSDDESSDEESDRNKDHGRGRGDRRQPRRSGNRSSGNDSSWSRSRQRSATHQRRWLKPEKFDGRSSFETFMYMFENCATYNKWNKKDKSAHLRWSLTGIAAQLLCDTESLEYDDLVEKLRARFGGKGMEERFQTELRCRRRARGESLRELAQDVRRLMSLAYPGEKSSMADHIARDAFLVALDDPEFELKIREREPIDLDSAVKMAQRLEVSRGVVDASAGTRHRAARQVVGGDIPSTSSNTDLEARMVALENQLRSSSVAYKDVAGEQRDNGRSGEKRGKRSNPKENRAVNKEETSWKDELLKRVHELERAQSAGKERAKQLTNENEVLNKEVDRLKHLNELHSKNAVPAERASFNQPSQATGVYQSIPQKPVVVCWTCGEPGHFARDHKQGQPESGQPRANGYPGVTSSHRVAGTSTGSEGKKGSATYLRAAVDDRVQDCLLDTGSEVSLLPASLVREELLRPTTQTLRAANGTEIAVLGEATLSFKTQFFTSTVSGIVSDHIAEIMLGVDWLTQNDAVWDFRKGQVCLGGRSHLLCQRRGERRWCRRVVLQENVEIPARSQMDVLGKVVFHGRPSSDSDLQWGTKPATIVKGVHVARTLAPNNRFTDLPVRVMNVQSQPMTIKAGAVISDLEPVTIIGTCVEDEKQMSKSDETMVKTLEGERPVEGVPQFVEELVNGVDDATPESAATSLEQLLVRYEDVFSKSEYDLGRTDAIKHCIDTGSAKPVRQQLRRFPPAHVETISKHVDDMLSQGIIEPTSSPWASNVVLVRKKDSSYRCCIDYRQLNSVTRRDAYPLPRIDSCLDAMSEAKWFSTFDMRSSYHQVPVAKEDTDKTAFICPRGMYKYKTMPFGLCNAGATFQRLMDVVLSGLHMDICLVYLDDIIVYSKTVEQHLERLETVLQRLRHAGLKLKPEKCKFFQRSVSFLGHIISDEGIGTDPEKTRAVMEWPTPTNVGEVRAFVGLASYYRRYVRNFAKIAAPLHALMKKNQRFCWTEDAQKSFEELKTALTTSPILAMPNDTGEFVLDTDASANAIGAVLSQRQQGAERVVAYASRSLDRREQNYCVTRKELLAIVYFLKYFKQYLLGRAFKVRTDHAALTWLRRTPEPIGQQARWLEQMEEYDFVVEHRAGSSHSNADSLSRRPCAKKQCRCQEDTSALFGGPADRPQSEFVVAAVETRSRRRQAIDGGERDQENIQEQGVSRESRPPTGPSNETVLPWSLEGLRAAQRSDADIGFLIELIESGSEQPEWETIALKSSDVKTLCKFWPRLSIRDGLLKRRFESNDGRSERWQVVWPKELRTEFLTIAHGGMTGGHMGLKKTTASVQSRAYWPTWSSDLALFVKGCSQCASYHRGTLPRRAELQTPRVGEPWERISVDITGPHPKSSKQNQYILTVIDHFSKWAEAIPIRNHTAPVVARALMVHVFSRFGTPLQLLSDRGPEFESELFSELMKWLEIDKIRTTPYKASTNGCVERLHRTMNSMLGKVVSESQRDWDERLPFVMAAYRASPHSSTGFTPNRLFLGRENRMPLDLIMGLPREECDRGTDVNEFVSRQQENAEQAYSLARNHLQVAAERRKRTYDIRVRRAEYSSGDWVWYYYPRRYARKSAKWQKLYTGPYLVVRVIPPVNYVLQRTQRSAPFVVHCDKLKRCFSPTPPSWLAGHDHDGESTPGPPDAARTGLLPADVSRDSLPGSQ